VVYGDIKPENVLVFKDATGNTTVKITDFGYSTLASGPNAKGVLLPKSRPWNAPEHHFGEFGTHEAKKTDVYSFGMLCLWILFSKYLSDIPPHSGEYGTESVSFDAVTGPLSLLERLKGANKVEHIADQLMQLVPELNAECKIRLKDFFSLTVPFDPEKQTSYLETLVGLLSQDR